MMRQLECKQGSDSESEGQEVGEESNEQLPNCHNNNRNQHTYRNNAVPALVSLLIDRWREHASKYKALSK